VPHENSLIFSGGKSFQTKTKTFRRMEIDRLLEKFRILLDERDKKLDERLDERDKKLDERFKAIETKLNISSQIPKSKDGWSEWAVSRSEILQTLNLKVGMFDKEKISPNLTKEILDLASSFERPTSDQMVK
jgi:hypothetical protein